VSMSAPRWGTSPFGHSSQPPPVATGRDVGRTHRDVQGRSEGNSDKRALYDGDVPLAWRPIDPVRAESATSNDVESACDSNATGGAWSYPNGRRRGLRPSTRLRNQGVDPVSCFRSMPLLSFVNYANFERLSPERSRRGATELGCIASTTNRQRDAFTK